MDKLFDLFDRVAAIADLVAPHIAEEIRADVAALRSNPGHILDWIKHGGNMPGTPGHRPWDDNKAQA